MISVKVNGVEHQIDAAEDALLLWVIREHLGLTGTKYSCGIGECGACTVHVNGEPERACSITLGEVQGKDIRTIEGVPEDHPIKRAWILEQAPQCGYCQPGQMMQAAHLLKEHPNPDDGTIVNAMDDVLCRCGSYPRIKKAILTASRIMRQEGLSNE